MPLFSHIVFNLFKFGVVSSPSDNFVSRTFLYTSYIPNLAQACKWDQELGIVKVYDVYVRQWEVGGPLTQISVMFHRQFPVALTFDAYMRQRVNFKNDAYMRHTQTWREYMFWVLYTSWSMWVLKRLKCRWCIMKSFIWCKGFVEV